jgi:hypothetical protein
VAPDFVVTVHVVFETAEGTFHYSKCYIPRIELIDHNTAKNKISDIRAYSEKCRTQQSTGTLSNNSGVRVYNPDGNRLVEKTLRLYDKIK